MKLSSLKVDDLKVKEPATSLYSDSQITNIVFSKIEDDKKFNEWCIVFGNSIQLEARVNTVIEQYANKRFNKIIICGGTDGISNEGNTESEALRMKKKLLNNNIPESIIYLDETSNNTFENIANAMHIIEEKEKIKGVTIITSEYHLKRCVLAFKKMYPDILVTTIAAHDGYSDKDNWYNGSNEWNTGRCIVIWERNLLTKYAIENKIADIDI